MKNNVEHLLQNYADYKVERVYHFFRKESEKESLARESAKEIRKQVESVQPIDWTTINQKASELGRVKFLSEYPAEKEETVVDLRNKCIALEADLKALTKGALKEETHKKEETRKSGRERKIMTNKTNEVLNTVENATTKPVTTKATKQAETKTVKLTKKELKAIARNEKKAEATKKEITREQLGLYPTKAFKATRYELTDLLAATRLLEAKRQARDNAPKGSTEREHAKAEFEAAQKVRNEKFKTATFTIAAEQEIERFMKFVLYGTLEERINSGVNLLEALGLRVNGAENRGKAILLLTRAVPMKRANWNTMNKTGKIAGLAQKEFHKMLVDLVVYVALENEQI